MSGVGLVVGPGDGFDCCTQKSVYLRLEGLKDTSKCSHHDHLVHRKPIKCLRGYLALLNSFFFF